MQRKYSLPDTFVLFVGTIEPRKNLETLVAAMERLDTPLVIVGPDGWGSVDVSQATLLGTVPDEDLSSILAAASILAYPSRFEGFGLPVLEAMAQGTPVLVTELTAPAVIAGDAGVHVNTRSREAIAGAISDLLAAPDEIQQMGLAGRERASIYRWSDTARAHAAIFEELS